MLTTFLHHQWKGFWRSQNRGGTIAAQIFMGFAVLYLLAIALVIGFSIEKIIPMMLPGKDVMLVFNGLILYYFAIDFVARLQLQDLPTLSIVPYLHLNIPRSKLVSFLNVRAIFTAFNLFPLIIFLPFCSTVVGSTFGGLVSAMYCLAIISLALLNNYAALYVKRETVTHAYLIFVVMGTVAAVALLEYTGVFSIASLSDGLFGRIATMPVLALMFPILAVGMFIVHARYLRSRLYTEELSSGTEKKASTDLPFLDRFGEAGILAALEVKLIMRHKRPRSAVLMSLLFVFYGFLFYKEKLLATNSFGTMIFAATFMTGSAISIYGQFMFGWQGAHFDGLLANRLSTLNFIRAKFLIFTVSSTVITLLVSFYGFIDWKIVMIQLAAYLYNIGIGSVVVLYFATRNYKAIDLSKGAGFNYQGVGASQFVLILPYFLLPYLFYLPFSMAGLPYWGLAALGAAGLVCLLTRRFWIRFIVKQFELQKYKIAAGFRETS